jgi:hypothetical protein
LELVESIDSHSSSNGGGAGSGLSVCVSTLGWLVDKKSCDTIGVSSCCKYIMEKEKHTSDNFERKNQKKVVNLTA